jgi:MinD superfamily P-loop ATPase
MITDKCIKCASCETFCKNGAITEADDQYVIDETKCETCGTCSEYCPIDFAIVKKIYPELAVELPAECK